MPKEQIRVKLPKEANKLSSYKGKKANLVLRDGRSVIILSLNYEGNKVSGLNTRRMPVEFVLEDLDEVLLDVVKN